MFASKVKIVTAILLAVSLTTGAGVATHEALSAKEDGAIAQAAPQRAEEGPNKPAAKDYAARTPKAPQQEEPGERIALSGRVLDPDGKPLSGARLYWPRLLKEMPKTPDDIDLPECGVSDADGRFKLDLLRPQGPLGSRMYLVARADGYGLGWEQVSQPGNPAELTLRLVKDEPIRGRILNTEGKPLAGVRVSVGTLMANADGRLDGFVTAWKQEWELASQRMSKQAYLPPGKVLPAATTDKDGRFQIAGAGTERVVLLEVKGPTLAQATLYVLNRAGLDLKPINRAAQDRVPPQLRLPGQPPLLYGPSFDYVANPSRMIEGTVREAGSGKPAAGIPVYATAGYNNGIQTVSDEEGRYRLAGLPKMKEYTLITEPNDKGPWLRRTVQVPDTEGLQPIKLDIELVRGIVVSGRVIDKATGKGVESGVRFVPLPDNKYFGKKPGYDRYRRDRLMTPTDSQGRFRLVTIPGTGVLMAQTHGGDANVGGVQFRPYKVAEFDAEDRKHIQVNGDDRDQYYTGAGGTVEILGTENAVKRLDVAENAGTVICDLVLDRGKTLTVYVQDPDGKALSGAIVGGMTASWPTTFPLNDSSCTIYALDPEKPRTLVFFHAGRKLAGSLTVRGDEKERPVVRLTAPGAVTGRLLDADGQPIIGVNVLISAHDRMASELYRHLDQQREAFRTDGQGRFHIEGVVPDVKFGLDFLKGRTYFTREPRLGLKQVAAGKTLDLGDLRTKPFQP